MTARKLQLRSAPAFTLVELVVAMGIMAMLLLAVQSTIVLASRSIPDGRSKAMSLVTSSAALDAVSADLTFASAIISRSATAITVQVPDRNGDSIPDTITWSWSGTRGSPLTRTFNGGAEVIYAANVQAFSLAYDLRKEKAPTTYTASRETLFLSNPPALLFNSDNEIRSDQRIGQYFKPNLPANATSWAITRVQIMAQVRSSDDGESSIQIRPVNTSGLPTTTVLDSARMIESSLGGDYSWRQFSFTKATGLSPSFGAALIVNWVSGDESCEVQAQALSLPLSGANMLKSSNGSDWTSQSLNALNCYVYGTYSTQDPVSYLYYLSGARATLLTSNDAGATARNAIRMINELQVASP